MKPTISKTKCWKWAKAVENLLVRNLNTGNCKPNILFLCRHCLSDGQFISQPLEQKSTLQAESPPQMSEVKQTQVMQQKTSPWESMSEMRIILVMEMREGKIYPMLVLEGGFLHGNLFMKTCEPTRVMWAVPSLFSISTNNFISGMDSKGDSCCSMTCYWFICEVGKLFFACNGNFCSSGWLMNCLSDRQCLYKNKQN